MKKVEELNKSKVPIVAIDLSLNKYRDKTLFPEKLALANKQLKGVKLPSKKSAATNNPTITQIANIPPKKKHQ